MNVKMNVPGIVQKDRYYAICDVHALTTVERRVGFAPTVVPLCRRMLWAAQPTAQIGQVGGTRTRTVSFTGKDAAITPRT